MSRYKFEVQSCSPALLSVNYKGITLTITCDCRYIATDSIGHIYGFLDEPILNEIRWTSSNINDFHFILLAQDVIYDGSWKDSLMKVW